METHLIDGIYRDGMAIGIKGNPEHFTGKDRTICEMYNLHEYKKPLHRTKLMEMILLLCFFDEDICKLSVQYLRNEHFKVEANKHIFEAICSNYTHGQLPTFKNVYRHCLTKGNNVAVKLVSLYNSDDYPYFDIIKDFKPKSIETIKRIIQRTT